MKAKAHEGDRPFNQPMPEVSEHDVNEGHIRMTAPIIKLGGHNGGNGPMKPTQPVNQ